MPIQFNCVQCGKVLRTGDETAGKQARCPECGTVQPIPAAGAAAPPAPPPPPGNPFSVAAAPRADAPNPYQSPAVSREMPRFVAGSPGKLPVVPTLLSVEAALNRSFAIFRQQMGPCISVAAILFGLQFGMNLVGNFITLGAQATRERAVVILAQLAFFLIGMVLQTWLQVGQVRFFLNVGRGGTPVIQDVFSGGPWLLRILGWTMVAYFAVLAVALLCGAPFLIAVTAVGNLEHEAVIAVAAVSGAVFAMLLVWLVLRLVQSYFLVIDQDVPVLQSFPLSWEITRGNVLAQFVVGLCNFGLMFAGVLACCVGLLFALPVVLLIQAVVFLTMSGQYHQPSAPAA